MNGKRNNRFDVFNYDSIFDEYNSDSILNDDDVIEDHELLIYMIKAVPSTFPCAFNPILVTFIYALTHTSV